jgi:hypothetical protein
VIGRKRRGKGHLAGAPGTIRTSDPQIRSLMLESICLAHGSDTNRDEPLAACISPPICAPWYPFPAPTQDALPSITHLRFHVGTLIWLRVCEHVGKDESVRIEQGPNASRALEGAGGAANSPPRPLSSDWHVAGPHARRYDGRILGLSRYGGAGPRGGSRRGAAADRLSWIRSCSRTSLVQGGH